MKLRAGFTIIELMVTLAVVAVAITLAVPSFANFMRNQRVTSQANELLVSLTFARSEAIKRGLPISVCASDDPQAANPGCSGNNTWHNGWVVFVDVDAPGPDGSVNPDGVGDDDTVLRVHNAINSSQLTADNGAAWLAFGQDGLALVRDDFTLDPDGCTGDQRRSIDVQATGRAQIEGVSC